MDTERDIKDGGFAFPQGVALTEREHVRVSADFEGCGGMSMRDYFAAQALVGLTVVVSIANGSMLNPDQAAPVAYQFADAMLAERAK